MLKLVGKILLSVSICLVAGCSKRSQLERMPDKPPDIILAEPDEVSGGDEPKTSEETTSIDVGVGVVIAPPAPDKEQQGKPPALPPAVPPPHAKPATETEPAPPPAKPVAEKESAPPPLPSSRPPGLVMDRKPPLPVVKSFTRETQEADMEEAQTIGEAVVPTLPRPPLEEVRLQEGQFCLTESRPLTHPTRILFVVDRSRHNWQSDRDGLQRIENIRRFFETNKENGWYSWGMISFYNRDDAKPEIWRRDSGNTPTFTKDPQLVDRAINNLIFHTSDAGSEVGYKEPLKMAKEVIENDLEQFPRENANYVVFFIAGERPADYDNYDDLQEDVQEIIDLKPGKISLSTVYYGFDHIFDRQGEIRIRDILKTMAYIGRGGYVELEDSPEQNDSKFYALLQSIQTPEAWHLQDQRVVVHNLNATICEDGLLDVDSDSDFLCDRDEERYGFNPQHRFSFPQGHSIPDKIRRWRGYGDYFRYREVYKRDMLSECSDAPLLDTDHDFLTDCEEKHIINTDPNMRLRRTSSDPRLPDTDGDGFIDGLEFSYFKYTDGRRGGRLLLDRSNVRSTFDGEEVNAGDQILQHRNPFQQDAGAFEYQMQVTPRISALGPNGGSNCYQYQQSQIKLYPTKAVFIGDTLSRISHEAHHNMILVYFVMTPRLTTAPWQVVYQYGLQTLVKPDETDYFIGLNFDYLNFQMYSVFLDLLPFLRR